MICGRYARVLVCTPHCPIFVSGGDPVWRFKLFAEPGADGRNEQWGAYNSWSKGGVSPRKLGLSQLDLADITVVDAMSANSRPDLNVFASPIVAIKAVAVSRPVPGTSEIARHAASCFCQPLICFSSRTIAPCFCETILWHGLPTASPGLPLSPSAPPY
jgi:hypothetical protein